MKTPPNNNFRFPLVFLVIFVLYFALRLISLTIVPVFADEAIYIRWAQVMRAEPSLRFLPLTDGKQPLFMWLIIPFLKITSDPLVAGRLVSVFAGFGTMLGLTLLSYLLFRSKYLSLFAAILYLISPFCLFFDRMAMADGLLSTFYLWSVILIYLTAVQLRLDTALLAGFTIGFAWLTKSPALFLIVLLPLGLITTRPLIYRQSELFDRLPFLNGRIFRSTIIRQIILFSITAVLAVGIYNLLRLGPEFQQIALRNRDYVYSVDEILKHPLFPMLPNLATAAGWYWVLLTPTTIGLFALGIYCLAKTQLNRFIYLFGWLIIPLVAQSTVARVYTARYLLFTVPFFILIAAGGLDYLFTKITQKFTTTLVLSLLFTVPLYFSIILIINPQGAWLPTGERSGYLEEWTAGFGIKEVADYIKTIKPTQKVLVGTEGYFGTLPDGLQIYLEKLPNIRVVGVGLPISQVPEALTNALSDNEVFLVGNDSRFYLTNNPAVKLIKAYPKATQKNGQQEHLLFYQVLHP